MPTTTSSPPSRSRGFQLGWLGWLLVLAGGVFALLGGRERPPVALVVVPVLAAGVVLVGLLTTVWLDGFALRPSWLFPLPVAGLIAAFVVAWRDGGRRRAPSRADRVVVHAACVVLAVVAILPWSAVASDPDWWLEDQAPWLLALPAAVAGAVGVRGAPGGTRRRAAAGTVIGLIVLVIVIGVEGRPTTPAPFLAIGSAALVCAVLLRPAEDGGTL